MSYLAYLIYEELRHAAADMMNHPPHPPPMDPYGSGAYSGPPPAQSQAFPAPGNASYSGPRNDNNSRPGFKAFSGKGHRLGDS